MNALEKRGAHDSAEFSGPHRNDVQVLGADDHIHLLIFGKSGVHTFKLPVFKHNLVVLKHHTVDDVALADEVCNITVDGLVVNVRGRTDLLDVAVLHDDDLVGHGQGLFLIVSDEDEGDADLLLNLLQLALHALAKLCVQSAERLVEKKHLGLIDKGAGDGDTLLLTAGHLVNGALAEVLEAHELKHTHDLLINNILRLLLDLEAESNVVKHIHVREQRVLLEHGVEVPLVGRQV